jgi:hypothetical protein
MWFKWLLSGLVYIGSIAFSFWLGSEIGSLADMIVQNFILVA